MSEFDDLEKKLAAKKEWNASEPERNRKAKESDKEQLEQVVRDTNFIDRLDSIVDWMNTKTGPSFSSKYSVELTYPNFNYSNFNNYIFSYRIYEKTFFLKKEYFEIEASYHGAKKFMYRKEYPKIQAADDMDNVLRVKMRGSRKENFMTCDTEEIFFEHFKNSLVFNIDNHARFKI